MIEDYDFPCSYTWRSYYSERHGEYLPPITDPRTEAVDRIMEKIERTFNDMAQSIGDEPEVIKAVRKGARSVKKYGGGVQI